MWPRYKLGVALLPIARQRVARVVLAAQDLSEQKHAKHATTGPSQGEYASPTMLQQSATEEQAQKLLMQLQACLPEKQVRTCIVTIAFVIPLLKLRGDT